MNKPFANRVLEARPICRRCHEEFYSEEGDDNHGTKLCYFCFEESLEEFEENRRRKIAERNEY